MRRFGIFTLVVCGHVTLILLLIDTRERERFQRETSARRSLLLFPSSPKGEGSGEMQLHSPSEPRIQTDIAIDVSAPSDTALFGTSLVGELAPPTDWKEEARRAVTATVENMPKTDPSKCDSTGLEDPTLPNCKPTPQFKWAPPKSGFSNGLPYVTLGDRCVVGLGFFGCALGKPPANGDLFEGMDDPARERSSVPASPHRPRSAVPSPDGALWPPR